MSSRTRRTVLHLPVFLVLLTTGALGLPSSRVPDGLDRIMALTEGTRATAMTYSGGLSVAEHAVADAASSLPPQASSLVEYQRGPDMGGGVGGLLYSLRSSSIGPQAPNVRFNLSNGRGDVVAQSDTTGALTWTASYEAYGKRPVETGSNADRQRANTKEEDPTGLLNEGFRYRDLETGVWLSRDPAGFVDGPNLYAYVRQNPWTSFDPDGLDAKLVTETAGDQTITTFIIRGVVVDHSGQDFTVRNSKGEVHRTHQQELELMRKNIEDGVRNQFTGKAGNRSWKADVQLRLVKDAKDASDSDHVFKIIFDTKDFLGQAAGFAHYGGKSILLQSPDVRVNASETAGHEMGHSLGLRHPDVDGTKGFGKDPDNPIPNLGKKNFMGYDGNEVDERQIQLMQHYHDHGDLNGAHYDKEGKWKSDKTESEVFGKKRFKGGTFPESSAKER